MIAQCNGARKTTTSTVILVPYRRDGYEHEPSSITFALILIIQKQGHGSMTMNIIP